MKGLADKFKKHYYRYSGRYCLWSVLVLIFLPALGFGLVALGAFFARLDLLDTVFGSIYLCIVAAAFAVGMAFLFLRLFAKVFQKQGSPILEILSTLLATTAFVWMFYGKFWWILLLVALAVDLVKLVLCVKVKGLLLWPLYLIIKYVSMAGALILASIWIVLLNDFAQMMLG